MDKLYVIIPTVDITNAMKNTVKLGGSNVDNLRTNTDGTKTVFKVCPPHEHLFIDYTFYNREEMCTELQNVEWS